jgi:hypothetical protein
MATDFEVQVLTMLGDIKADLAKNTEATEALGGEHGRVTSLEARAKTAETRQWIHSVAIFPAMGLLHEIARRLGVTI